MSRFTVEGFQNNAMANRASISAIGIDIPWILTARNKDERIEKIFDVVVLNTIAYSSPWLLVRHLNKIYSKQKGLETPKLLQISSQYLDIEKINSLIQQGKKLEHIKSSIADVPDLASSLQQLGFSRIKTLEHFKEMIPKITKAKSLVLLTDILVIASAELAEN